jgi:hypothetical protein
MVTFSLCRDMTNTDILPENQRVAISAPTFFSLEAVQKDGLAGIIEDRPRTSHPKRITAEQKAAIVEATMKTTRKDATHRSAREMPAARGGSVLRQCNGSGQSTNCSRIAW